MDWIDSRWLQLKKFFLTGDLKRSLTAYFLSMLVMVYTFHFIADRVLSHWIDIMVHNATHPYIQYVSPWLKRLLWLRTYDVFFWILLGTVVATRMFYRHRIRAPLDHIAVQVAHLKRNDLTFGSASTGCDELSAVCTQLDSVRRTLSDTYSGFWRQIQAQRQVHKALAHEVRTPITVIQTQTELLALKHRRGVLTDDALDAFVRQLLHQTRKLEKLTEKITATTALKDGFAQKKALTAKALQALIENELHTVKSTATYQLPDVVYHLDAHTVLTVLQNLLSNATRYAKTRVHIDVSLDEKSGLLAFVVKDDGEGFSDKALLDACSPYFSESDGHFGLGLFLCRTLCEQHGGRLTLYNHFEGGAMVQAQFYVL